MNKIVISDLAVLFKVGVPPEERAKPQRLLITIEMETDFSRAAATDDLTNTIDYYAVTQKVTALGENRTWKLIEKLAVDIADMVLEEFSAQRVLVRVKKFIIPQTQYISVETLRESRER